MHTKYSLMLPAARPLKVIHASGWRSACLVIVLGMFHCYLRPVTLQHKNLFHVTMQSCLDFIVCQVQVRGPEESIAVEFQHRILNPLSKARDRTRNLMVPSWICSHCTTVGTPIMATLE
uniref:Uncharacterized protein n=2 Tax=Sus scrofa TaxID=9823 RepID=A0A8D0T782_PIG